MFVPMFLGSAFDKTVEVLVGSGATQFVLDDSHLLVKEVFALLTVHFLTGFVLDVVADAEVFCFFFKVFEELFGSLFVALIFEKFLLFVDGYVELGGYEIEEYAVAVDVAEGVEVVSWVWTLAVGFHLLEVGEFLADAENAVVEGAGVAYVGVVVDE